MRYETLVDDCFVELPEYYKIYRGQEENGLIDGETGAHVIFGIIIVPMLIQLFYEEEKNRELIKRTFDFFEKMAKSEDIKIYEVLDFTVLESIVDQGKNLLKRAKAYMGAETLEDCQKIELYFLQ